MISVQAAGCGPISKVWEEHKQVSEFWKGAQTLAAGLRVPKANVNYIILDILKKSGGTAISVSDHEIVEAVRECASTEGIFAAPEGAACLVAYMRLTASGFLKPSDRVVLFNTGSGLNYIEVFADQMGRTV